MIYTFNYKLNYFFGGGNMISSAYISVGSNIGDRLLNLRQAVSLLKQNLHISNIIVSSVYETEPVGDVVQDSFYNIALRLDTDLTAFELLDFIHDIEQRLHRKRIVRWGPRTIDLDIIDFGGQTIKSENLTIPHKERDNRRFVLVPLLEISTDDANYHELIQDKLNKTSDTNWINIIESSEVFN